MVSKGGRLLSMKLLQALTLLCMILLASGCSSVPVAEDIGQHQAIEIVALLQANGITASAERQVGGRAQYTVEVRQSAYAEAVAILASRSLPSKEKETFSDFVAPRGFLPDSRETEALRLDHALGLQLEELLSTLPGVLRARAIVRQNFGTLGSGGSVSVFLLVDERFAIGAAAIRETASKVVPGTSPESVFLSIQKGSAGAPPVFVVEGTLRKDGEVVQVPLIPFVLGLRIPEEDYVGIILFFGGFALLALGAGLLVGYWIGFLKTEVSRPANTLNIPRLSHLERTKALEHHSPEVE